MSDEQRVRTLAGQVGVEISRSRVRTPGKTGYGLYRVRGSEMASLQGLMVAAVTEWTPYAFTLEQVRVAVMTAIENGRPEGPGVLRLAAWPDLTPEYRVLTRWTPAYRGPRNLGMRRREAEREASDAGDAAGDVVVAIKPEFTEELVALAALIDEGLLEMTHVEGCACEDPQARMSAACVRATMPAARRQRAANAAFHAEHMERRKHGLRARYAAKEARQNKGRPADGNAQRGG